MGDHEQQLGPCGDRLAEVLDDPSLIAAHQVTNPVILGSPCLPDCTGCIVERRVRDAIDGWKAARHPEHGLKTSTAEQVAKHAGSITDPTFKAGTTYRSTGDVDGAFAGMVEVPEERFQACRNRGCVEMPPPGHLYCSHACRVAGQQWKFTTDPPEDILPGNQRSNAAAARRGKGVFGV